MASKAITGLGSERTETKGPVGNVAIDCIATRRRQAKTFSSSTASTQCTNLKAPQLPPSLIHHQSLQLTRFYQWHIWKFIHLIRPICLKKPEHRNMSNPEMKTHEQFDWQVRVNGSKDGVLEEKHSHGLSLVQC